MAALIQCKANDVTGDALEAHIESIKEEDVAMEDAGEQAEAGGDAMDTS